MKKKVIGISSILIFTILIAVGVSFAHFTSKDSVVNVFNTGNIDIEVDETVDDSKNIKQVWIENKGPNDCLVRVSIIPRWVDKDGNPTTGDINMIELGFNKSNNWLQGSDGFYYYTHKLESGGTTSNLLETVKVKDNIPDEYKFMTLKIDVKSEAVQANRIKNSDNTYEYPFKSTWRNIDDDNITTILEKLCQ